MSAKWAKGTGGPSGDEVQNLTLQQTPAVLMTMRERKFGGGKGPLLATEESLTLATGNGQTLFDPVPVAYRKSKRAQSDTDDETWVADGNANTLTVFDGGDTRTTHAIVEPVPGNGKTLFEPQTEPYVLQGTMINRAEKNGPGGFGWRVGESYTLHTVEPSFIAGHSYGVRRLTPVECERLQAFPDGWTEPAGSDSARYKALGNAVTVTVPHWLFGRIMEVGE